MGFWGKLSEDRSQYLPLADHCVDVASVFRALCDLPAIRRSLELGENAVRMDRLAVFALLHDLGKCNTGFQAKRDQNARDTAGHVKETAVLLYDPELAPMACATLGLEEMWSWFDNPEADLPRMLLAAVFHHGKPAFKDEISQGNDVASLKMHWLPRNGIDPFDGLRELGKTARRAFPNAFEGNAAPIEVSIELEHRRASPAHAGIDLKLRPHQRVNRRFPRACGDRQRTSGRPKGLPDVRAASRQSISITVEIIAVSPAPTFQQLTVCYSA